jgi:hypothetical protein
LKAEPEVVDLGAELVPEALFRVAEPELFVGEAPPVEGEPEPEGALVPTGGMTVSMQSRWEVGDNEGSRRTCGTSLHLERRGICGQVRAISHDLLTGGAGDQFWCVKHTRGRNRKRTQAPAAVWKSGLVQTQVMLVLGETSVSKVRMV